MKLVEAFHKKADLLGVNCEKLSENEQGIFAGRTYIIYDKKTGWDVQYFNFFQRFLRAAFGFYKSSQQQAVKAGLDADRIGDKAASMKERLQSVWWNKTKQEILNHTITCSQEAYMHLLQKLSPEHASELLDIWWNDTLPDRMDPNPLRSGTFPLEKMVRAVEDPVKIRPMVYHILAKGIPEGVRAFRPPYEKPEKYPLLNALEENSWKVQISIEEIKDGMKAGKIPADCYGQIGGTFPNIEKIIGYGVSPGERMFKIADPLTKQLRKGEWKEVQKKIGELNEVRRDALLLPILGPSVKGLANSCGGLTTLELFASFSDAKARSKLLLAVQTASSDQLQKLKKTIEGLPRDFLKTLPRDFVDQIGRALP